MKEELQRQIDAVIEENQLLRKGNEELMVAVEELRQRKNDLLQIYRVGFNSKFSVLIDIFT